jgi:uncharacterized protein (DUF58 family)
MTWSATARQTAGAVRLPPPPDLPPPSCPRTPDNDERLTRIMKRVRRIELITRGMVKETLGGQYHSRFKGRASSSMTSANTKPGDDVRFMDWNVTARMNEPFVRKYIEERELTVMLVRRCQRLRRLRKRRGRAKRERAAELAAVFAFSAVQNQDKVGLILFSRSDRAIPARAQRLAARAAHSARHPEPPTEAARAPTSTPRSSSRSGAHRPPRTDHHGLRLHHAPIMLVGERACVPWRPSTTWSWRRSWTRVRFILPDAGRVCLEDPETGRANSSSTPRIPPCASSLRTTRGRAAERAWTHLLRRCGVERIAVRTDQDYVPALKAYFRTRKRRRRG